MAGKFGAVLENVNKGSKGLDAAGDIMGKLQAIGTLNARGKQARFIHENIIEGLGIQKRQVELGGISDEFQARRRLSNASAAAGKGILSSQDKLRRIAANANLLGSQIT